MLCCVLFNLSPKFRKLDVSLCSLYAPPLSLSLLLKGCVGVCVMLSSCPHLCAKSKETKEKKEGKRGIKHKGPRLFPMLLQFELKLRTAR